MALHFGSPSDTWRPARGEQEEGFVYRNMSLFLLSLSLSACLGHMELVNVQWTVRPAQTIIVNNSHHVIATDVLQTSLSSAVNLTDCIHVL